MNRITSPFFVYLLVILLGLSSGYSDISVFHHLGTLVSDLFIRMFKCISLPIIALSIIVTLSEYRSTGLMRRVWQKTLTYTLTTTLIAATVSCMLYLMISPEPVMMQPTTGLSHDQTNGSYWMHLSKIIPSSFLSPFLENQAISVLFISIIIGIAIRFIPEIESRKTITHFFHGLHSVMMVLTRWVVMIIPIGLYGFITTTVLQLRQGGELKGIGQYLLIIVLSNVVQGFIILPLWLKYNKIKPFYTMRAMLPALSLAFFSKSSVGTLPVTMETIEQRLKVKPELSRFILPLCTSINMNGCAAFIFTTVIYLMQNNGMHLSFVSMTLWVIIATIAAIGNAGIPMGCFFLSISLLASMNVPIMLMGIILPFYSLIDMLETALNVWSDVCVTKVIDESTSKDV